MANQYPTCGMTLAERLDFHSMPEPNSGCQLWLGACDPKGYGRLSWERKLLKTHRLAWLAHRGPIPDGLHVLHKCDVPGCVNPNHLFLGTNQDNVSDREAKGRRRRIRGEMNGKASLTSVQVLAIRQDARSHRALAKAYGVHRTTIKQIKRGQTWTHI